MSSPPKNGMVWTGGSESDYIQSDLYLEWNRLISRHNIVSLHKFEDPTLFYDLVEQILFTFQFRYQV